MKTAAWPALTLVLAFAACDGSRGDGGNPTGVKAASVASREPVLEPVPAVFRVGEGTADITPPIGTQLAGYNPVRYSTGIHLPGQARVLVLEHDPASRPNIDPSLVEKRVVIVSLDVCALSSDFASQTRLQIFEHTDIPPENVRFCATHTHAMPTLRDLAQWGSVSQPYSDFVQDRVVEAVIQAVGDLASAELRIGTARVVGASYNRVAGSGAKTDDLFTAASTDADRWLDTVLHTLHFVRQSPKPPLLWYHFSCHPVTMMRTSLSSPDWPGRVAQKILEREGISPSFLQGHSGDIDPAGGAWPSSLEPVSEKVAQGVSAALRNSRVVAVPDLRQVTLTWGVPLQNGGIHPAPVSALALGDVAIVFHPGELFTYYGLALRRDSPFANTIDVGYADDFIGYLPDPRAYQETYGFGYYAAWRNPEFTGIPVYKPTVARELTAQLLALLQMLKGN